MIVGHERIVAVLKRLADTGELRHGYLFWGAEMTGKKTVARALANYLERRSFAEPQEGDALLGDCFLVSPNEKGNIGIDESRAIKYFLSQKPNRSSRRTVIIDKGECLTEEAQNALLKIAENPPASGLIIVVTKDPEGLKPTLLSRLQKLYFSPVPKKDLQRWLQDAFKLSASESETITERSFCEPGRAAAILRDARYSSLQKSARDFLKLSRSERRNFIKELVGEDGFSLESFLDALIAQVAVEKRFEIWHELLELRREANYFNVNPRLQLESLLMRAGEERRA